ncbi:hypothetical protein AMK34_13075 [Amycolatopsis sp. CB00013]|nr:hypothetical protein AMK34_13075 [Amycolatopsis sp. CB00013]
MRERAPQYSLHATSAISILNAIARVKNSILQASTGKIDTQRRTGKFARDRLFPVMITQILSSHLGIVHH